MTAEETAAEVSKEESAVAVETPAAGVKASTRKLSADLPSLPVALATAIKLS